MNILFPTDSNHPSEYAFSAYSSLLPTSLSSTGQSRFPNVAIFLHTFLLLPMGLVLFHHSLQLWFDCHQRWCILHCRGYCVNNLPGDNIFGKGLTSVCTCREKWGAFILTSSDFWLKIKKFSRTFTCISLSHRLHPPQSSLRLWFLIHPKLCKLNFHSIRKLRP